MLTSGFDILQLFRSTRHLRLKAETLKGYMVGRRWLFQLRTALSLVALLAAELTSSGAGG